MAATSGYLNRRRRDLREVVCPTCLGFKEVPCPECDGEDEDDGCLTCEGDAYVECDDCAGTGKAADEGGQ